jgi:hypothetical protein
MEVQPFIHLMMSLKQAQISQHSTYLVDDTMNHFQPFMPLPASAVIVNGWPQVGRRRVEFGGG